MRSKAQMEIMGLAMIVVLITLGFLFLVVFVVMQEESPALQRTRDKVFAENWVHTFLGTTTDCNDLTVRKLVQNCVRGSTRLCPDNRNQCAEIKQVLDSVRADTLELFFKDYFFKATGPNLDGVSAGTPCTGEQVAGGQEVPVFGYDVYVQLALCV